jgi:hypothetical protein
VIERILVRNQTDPSHVRDGTRIEGDQSMQQNRKDIRFCTEDINSLPLYEITFHVIKTCCNTILSGSHVYKNERGHHLMVEHFPDTSLSWYGPKSFATNGTQFFQRFNHCHPLHLHLLCSYQREADQVKLSTMAGAGEACHSCHRARRVPQREAASQNSCHQG